MALNYPLFLMLLWLLHDLLGLAVLVAAITSTGVLTAYNFVSSRWAIFARDSTQHSMVGGR